MFVIANRKDRVGNRREASRERRYCDKKDNGHEKKNGPSISSKEHGVSFEHGGADSFVNSHRGMAHVKGV